MLRRFKTGINLHLGTVDNHLTAADSHRQLQRRHAPADRRDALGADEIIYHAAQACRRERCGFGAQVVKVDGLNVPRHRHRRQRPCLLRERLVQIEAANQVRIAANRQHGQPMFLKHLRAGRRKIVLSHQTRLTPRQPFELTRLQDPETGFGNLGLDVGEDEVPRGVVKHSCAPTPR